jgi:hypothetical protein
MVTMVATSQSGNRTQSVMTDAGGNQSGDRDDE